LIMPLILSLPVVLAHGEDFDTDYIKIESSLGEAFTETASAAAHDYFSNLNETYFNCKLNYPLRVYLSVTPEQARGLIRSHGHLVEAPEGFYVPSVPAIYPYLKDTQDSKIQWEHLFSSIAEHLICQKFDDAPKWFHAGLKGFISEGAEITEGQILFSCPLPRRSMALIKKESENGTRLNIKKLFVSSDEKFRSWDIGKDFAELLFCWLYSNDNLVNYLRSANEKGYELEVLEEAVSVSSGKINMALTKFIRTECKAAANLLQAEQADDPSEKEALLQNALNSMGGYYPGRIALARLYYNSGKNLQCRSTLEPLLIQSDKIIPLTAEKLMAKCFYDKGDYIKALEHYQNSWEKSRYYPYRYQIAYKIANCYHYQGKFEEAAEWYQKFLSLIGTIQAEPKSVEYAKKYIAVSDGTDFTY